MKDLGDLKYILGIEKARSEHVLMLNQCKCTLDRISDIGLAGSKHVNTHMDFNSKLNSAEYDRQFNIGENDKTLDDVTAYRRLIGRLLYLTVTRPNIVCSLQHLSQFLQEPKQSHWLAALRIVKYVNQSSHMD